MDEHQKSMTVAFIGNPNCGKTTLFNDFTGANLKVANWPGVTVEKVEGAMRYHNTTYKLVDLPGTYSLTSYTLEEKISRQYIMSDEVDVIVDVVDASALERNLYLTLQLLELGKPVVVALNMMDIVEKRGMEIDLHRLPEMLGVPCIAVSAQKHKGLNTLLHAIAHHGEMAHQDQRHDGDPIIHHHHGDAEAKRTVSLNVNASVNQKHRKFAMVYSDEIENKIDQLKSSLSQIYGDEINNPGWTAIKLLEGDGEITEKYPVDFPEILDRSYETEIINQKYDFIEEIVGEVLFNKEKRSAMTNKVDKIFLHPVLGIPAFLCIMALVFLLTFTVGDWLKGFLETGIGWFSNAVTAGLTAAGCHNMLISLIVDGIIAGVGGILTFLPSIAILFLALAFLEDSGYMSRVAYVMNDLMSKLGLSGRAFIPMILGFGCTVPALMASRVLEDEKDRKRVMFVTPFMSCSARLPIYILFSGLFFPKYAGMVAFSMYLIGLLTAIVIVWVLHKTDKGEKEDYLLIELPEYKLPSARTVGIYVWEKVKDYLTKAGTVIVIASIIIWAVLNLGPMGFVTDMANSFGAKIGSVLVPVLMPVGLGFWQVVVALIAGISAKEVVVSSFIVLFGITGTESSVQMAALNTALSAVGFGPLNGLCMMVFCLLYVPCAAALATIRKEFGSTKAMFGMAVFQIAVAWVITFVIYQVGRLVI